MAGEDVSVGWLSDGINSRYGGMDLKREMAYASEDGSSSDGCRRRIWPKYPLSEITVGHVRSTSSGMFRVKALCNAILFVASLTYSISSGQ